MKKKKENTNIIKYRKPFNINIGSIIFVFILAYIVYHLFSYMTEVHISVYEVEQGTIAANNIYSCLVLRTEKIYLSNYSGSLNYYVKEYAKVGYHDLLYSVDESGSISEKINQASQDASGINKKTASEITEKIGSFKKTYQSIDYYNVYSFKNDINAVLSESLSLEALNNISEYAQTAEENQTFHRTYAEEPGIIAYYTDGFENVTIDNFDSSMFDKSSYNKVNLRSKTEIMAGEAAYKIIESESWNMVLQISESLAESLWEGSVIRIRFVKDSKEINADYSIIEKEGGYYLILSLKNSMIRYAEDRYIEIELMLSEESGLKIPNTSITEKEFYTIPKDYFTKGGDSGSDGILVESTDEQGIRTVEFISPTIYYKNDLYYYIDSEYVSAGDWLIREDSDEKYVVGRDTATLKGVYNINKGYAVFKQIDILYQNEEYSIVKTGTSYGISLYDHIALDGTKIQENELIQ